MKTKHKDNELNPTWEETFTFDNVGEDVDILSLSVWDKNAIRKDEFMGYAYVVLDACMPNQSNFRVNIFLHYTVLLAVFF